MNLIGLSASKKPGGTQAYRQRRRSAAVAASGAVLRKPSMAQTELGPEGDRRLSGRHHQ